MKKGELPFAPGVDQGYHPSELLTIRELPKTYPELAKINVYVIAATLRGCMSGVDPEDVLQNALLAYHERRDRILNNPNIPEPVNFFMGITKMKIREANYGRLSDGNRKALEHLEIRRIIPDAPQNRYALTPNSAWDLGGLMHPSAEDIASSQEITGILEGVLSGTIPGLTERDKKVLNDTAKGVGRLDQIAELDLNRNTYDSRLRMARLRFKKTLIENGVDLT